MVFSSSIFIFGFVPIFFLIYLLAVPSYKNFVILLGSTLFYAWGGPTFLLVLLFSLLIDWHLSNVIHKNINNRSIAKFYLLLALIGNIGLLVYFKYTNFFVENINLIFSTFNIAPVSWTKIVLPIGISFIVFHKISYIVDVYRVQKKPTSKMTDYFIYILLFPMSIAGPIIKYQDISEQITYRKTSFEDILYGSYRFSLGLFKKVWIADNVAIVADNVFGVASGEIGFFYSWIGIVCYALQIYFDFSGYADMAIGLSRIMGFKVSENFRMPYISQNITEFWRRWHISLSSWMKDYIYIPLGGNRVSKIRNYFNLWIVFVISGLWHGASWNFVIWGMIHGMFIVFDKLFWLKQSRHLSKTLNIFITFIIVLIAWVFFRANNLDQALNYLKSMFNVLNIGHFTPIQNLYISNSIIFFICLGLFLSFIPATRKYENFKMKLAKYFNIEWIQIITILFLLSISIVKCVSSSYSPFIYFRF